MNKAPEQSHDENLREALRTLMEKCPGLGEAVYWGGTSAVSLEELKHRQSFDLDLHTRQALRDVRPILARIRAAFKGAFTVEQAPDEFGSGFRGALQLPNGARVTIEVLSNYQDVPDSALVACTTAPGLKRSSLPKYLADKIQCVCERNEARDLVDICAVLESHPELTDLAKQLVSEEDPLLIAERLAAWTDVEISGDLSAYPDVDPADARWTRDLIISWLVASSGGKAI